MPFFGDGMEFPNKSLKVALVHDWLTGFRGGEKVLQVLCRFFPEASLYTLVHVPGVVPKDIEERKIYTSLIQRLPLGTQKYQHYLPIFPLAAASLSIKGYDLVVSTSHAVAKSVNTHGAPHWCYIHSPMRYVWDRFEDYFGVERFGWLASRGFFAPIASYLRWYDRVTAPRVHQYVANSQFVRKRVVDFYGLDAEVINPPAEVESFINIQRKPEDFYLFFSALVPYKKADHALSACQKLGKKLVIVGKGSELTRLQKMADPKLTQFHVGASNEEVCNYYATAKALLFPGIEDFGIVPVEASAAGLPVIGLNKGGLVDSQTDQTCHFYQSQTVDSLCDAITTFEESEEKYQDVSALRAQARLFSREKFEEKTAESLRQFWQRQQA
jgi:glycosyltransferase involved in cell wall biosynthesis